MLTKEPFFTADPHYGHEMIIEYTQRPFQSIKQMDRVLIENHNNVVSATDDIFILGDFSIKGTRYKDYLEAILRKLNGRKHLILGNHDRLKPFDYIDIGFTSVHTSYFYKNIILIHDPAVAVVNRDTLHFCGHVHTLFKECGNCINVGVDVRDFTPVPYETLRKLSNSITLNERPETKE